MKYVLGIESSCDDTGVAVIRSDKIILSNLVVSQLKEHAPYRGVVPEIAARSHLQNLKETTKRAIHDANITLNDLDAIAVTGGPGLIGGVLVGVTFAKTLASIYKKPFIALNHLEGHILTPRLTSEIHFPYLSLLVSGGHCQFVIVHSFGKYQVIGRTLDDSIGEAFDKVAKMLGLEYPGGPIIEKLAQYGDDLSYPLPLAMIGKNNADMSFSGIKTAVRLIIEKANNNKDQKFISDIAASFQYTVSKILAHKSKKAIEIFRNIQELRDVKNKNNLVITGGVAANQYLKNKVLNEVSTLGFNVYSPPVNLCTDNGAMIGWAGIEHLNHDTVSSLDFCPRAKWNLEDI